MERATDESGKRGDMARVYLICTWSREDSERRSLESEYSNITAEKQLTGRSSYLPEEAGAK